MPRDARFLVVLLWLAPVVAAADEPIISQNAGLPVVRWQEAGKHVGKTIIVHGKIVATRNIGSICFLNFDDPNARRFTAIVRKSNFGRFPKPPEVMYRGKLVRIRGTISEYQGRPQIEVFKPEQVTILEKDVPIPAPATPQRPTFSGTATVGTYNILNLFDEYDDPYHDDQGTPPKPRDQLERLAATIRQLDADVLALQEVENRGYLEQFVRAMLPDMGYQHVVCYEGNDRRGIDCAVLSRLPVGPVTTYRHLRFDDGSGKPGQFRRDLLQVRIEPQGFESFTIFVVHLKSKRGGVESTLALRAAEARQIQAILAKTLSRDPAARFLICGDFNDTWNSTPLETIRGAGPLMLKSFIADLPKKTVTYNRGRNRAMIDFLLCSPELAKRYQPRSIRVIDGSVESSGSDHNPVTIRFELKPTD